MRSHHCFPLKSSGVSPACGGALQKMTGWCTSVYSCLLCCLCSYFSTTSTRVQHIGIYVLSMVYCVAGRGFTKGSTVITWRDCGCRREGGHNVSTVCEIFLSFSLSSSFPVVTLVN
jgi:hypothetical protein